MPALSYGHLAITPVNRRAGLFCLLYLVAILYLSLYPWQFAAQRGPKSLIWVPLIGRHVILDAFFNMLFYMPLGAAAFLSMRRGIYALMGAAILGTLVSFSVEWAQLSIPTRYGNLLDLFSNSIGASLGAVVALVATSAPMKARLRLFRSPGPLLVGLWILWQAFALILAASWSRIDISNEIVGLFLLSLLAARRLPRLAVLPLILWLAFEELRPFRFQGPPQPFWWLPFESWFQGAPESYYGVLFSKLFFYTSIVWVMRASRVPWMWTVAAPAAIIAIGEWCQRYMPGRTPELTDLVLLAAGAFLLHCVEPV
jgi:VanZ family protein